VNSKSLVQFSFKKIYSYPISKAVTRWYKIIETQRKSIIK